MKRDKYTITLTTSSTTAAPSRFIFSVALPSPLLTACSSFLLSPSITEVTEVPPLDLGPIASVIEIQRGGGGGGGGGREGRFRLTFTMPLKYGIYN